MGRKLTPKQLELYKAIDEILWKDWDPIFGGDGTAPRDEYSGYVPQVFSLAIKKAAAKEIAEYLHKVVTESIGLSPSSIEAEMAIAEQIVNLAEDKLD